MVQSITSRKSRLVPIDSKSRVFHFLPAPNHIDVTAPDSREQGAEDGMTLRGVTRCHHDVTQWWAWHGPRTGDYLSMEAHSWHSRHNQPRYQHKTDGMTKSMFTHNNHGDNRYNPFSPEVGESSLASFRYLCVLWFRTGSDVPAEPGAQTGAGFRHRESDG